MKNSKILVSAIAPLKPFHIWDTATGEMVSLEVLEQDIEALCSFVQSEAKRVFEENSEQVASDASMLKGSANSYGRKLGYTSSYKSLPKEVLAKSRINELFLHKLMSEVASYARNPNPHKQYPTFPKTINLAAVDKAMTSLSRDGETLTLLWKCWTREYLLEFRIPAYVLKRDVAKYSLPAVRFTKTGYEFIFATQEVIPDLPKNRFKAGVDLGRVEPYTVAVVNGAGERVAHYTTSGTLKALNRKRELILAQKNLLYDKIRHYEKLGINPEVLVTEKARLGNKAKVLGHVIAQNLGAEITKKLEKHSLTTLNVENLTWAKGPKYGSKWNHSAQQTAIAHAILRTGSRIKKINPRNSSRHCHSCGTVLKEQGRKVRCSECQSSLDRDYNAALNIASERHLTNRYPSLINRLAGDDCSPRQVIGHTDHSSVIKLVT